MTLTINKYIKKKTYFVVVKKISLLFDFDTLSLIVFTWLVFLIL